MTASDPFAKLHDLIRLTSKASENTFRKTGELYPMYHAFLPDGSDFIFVCPDVRSKDELVALARALFELKGVTAYVFIDEAWTLSQKAAPDVNFDEVRQAFKQGIQDHSQRVEIVMFAAEDENGMVMADREIIRPKHGKARLGPLRFHSGATKLEGRMIGLLPKKRAQ